VRILTTDHAGDTPVRLGGIVTASAVSGANVLRDVREAITNTFGGKMTRYEAVLNETIARAIDNLADNARAAGYDGVLSVRLSHPMITEGAIEVVASGTGFYDASGTARDHAPFA